MKHYAVYKSIKRKLSRIHPFILWICIGFLAHNGLSQLQASQPDENTQTQVEQGSEPSLLDVIRQNQSEVDYIPFDFVIDSERFFDSQIADPYHYTHFLGSESYRYALTYERYRLISAIMDSALSATPEEFAVALDASEELTVQGQALLMLALFIYEKEYRPSLFDSETGERFTQGNDHVEKQLSPEIWARYEEYLIDRVYSQEVVYEPLVRNDVDRKTLEVNWFNSLRWNCANIIMTYPELVNETPLEAYALRTCQQGNSVYVRDVISSTIKKGRLPSGKERVYSNLGRTPAESSHGLLDSEYENKDHKARSGEPDESDTNQDDPWVYNSSLVKKISGDEAAKEVEYMKRYIEYINNIYMWKIIDGSIKFANECTTKQSPTLGDVAMLLLNARTRFQSREDFERLVGSLDH